MNQKHSQRRSASESADLDHDGPQTAVLHVEPQQATSEKQGLNGADGKSSMKADELTFSARMLQYQEELEHDYQTYVSDLETRDANANLAPMDWVEFEQNYLAEMNPKIMAEQEIMDQMAKRFQHFMLWMHVANDREAERAIKRLRTRKAFVQQSESRLVLKQQHYDKVLSAFHKAMELLGNM